MGSAENAHSQKYHLSRSLSHFLFSLICTFSINSSDSNSKNGLKLLSDPEQPFGTYSELIAFRLSNPLVKALSSLLITLLTLDKDDLDKNQTPISTSRFLEVLLGIPLPPMLFLNMICADCLLASETALGSFLCCYSNTINHAHSSSPVLLFAYPSFTQMVLKQNNVGTLSNFAQ